MPNRTGDIIFSIISVTVLWLPFINRRLASACRKPGTFFSYTKLCGYITEKANVGNWIIQSEQDSQNQLFAPVIAWIETHVTLLVVMFNVRYYLCLIWIVQTINEHFMLDSPIDLTMNCRAAIITHNRFLTRNVSLTKRISDSREKRDVSCEKRDKRW